MFKTNVKVDLEGLDKLRANVRESVSVEGRAGFKDEQRHPTSPISLAQIAYFNNFGTDGGLIPKRKFFLRAAKDSRKKVGDRLRKDWVDILKGKPPKSTFKKTSEYLADYIADVIRDNNFKRNAIFTVMRKGFNNPLTETGYLENNVMTDVERKDGQT